MEELYRVEIDEPVKRATDDAILITVEGENIWIPQSQIHDDSEVWKEGDTGELVIPMWLAEKKNLV